MTARGTYVCALERRSELAAPRKLEHVGYEWLWGGYVNRSLVFPFEGQSLSLQPERWRLARTSPPPVLPDSVTGGRTSPAALSVHRD